MACADPFNPNAAGACVPTFPARPSRKSHYKTRFSIVTNADGIGFCLIAPCLANNGRCYYYTGSTYNPALSGVINISDTGVVYNAMPTTWDTSYLGSTSSSVRPTVAARIVSFGGRIRDIGPDLYRAGTVTLFVDSSHLNLNLASMSALRGRNDCIIQAWKDREWVELVTAATSPNETAYPNINLDQANTNTDAILCSYPFSGGSSITANTPYGGACMLIYIEGASGSRTFEVELMMHTESVGDLESTAYTSSHADAEGTATVNEVLSNSYSERADTGESHFSSMLNQLRSFVADHSEQITTGAQMAASLFMHPATRALLRNNR